MIRACGQGHLSLDAANWECPWCLLAVVETEIRRIRDLLIGLAEHGIGDRQLDDNPDALETCHFCGEYTHDRHKADCVWAPVEAEVQAIRADRT